MKKRLFMLAVSLAAVIMIFTAFAYAEAKEAQLYKVNISVSKDATYKVTETVTVNTASGINGFEKRIPIENLIIKDVKGASLESDKIKGEYIITFGDELEMSSKGEKEYSFSYTVKMYDASDKEDVFDFLLLPQNLSLSIKVFEAHIAMPAAFNEENISILTKDGDSVGKRYTVSVENNKVDIKGNNITGGSSIRCRIALEEGYFSGATSLGTLLYFLIGILVLIPLLVFIFWLACGRDPKKMKLTQHVPPEGMTPVEMGYIADSVIDHKDVASMLIYFANKGYLRFEEYDKGKVFLAKIKDMPKSEKPFAITLFNGLFKKGPNVRIEDIDMGYADSYMTARKELREYYSSGGRRLYTRTSSILRGLGVILSMIPAAGSIICTAICRVEILQAAIAIPAATLILIGGFIVIRAFDKKYVLKAGERMKKYAAGGSLLLLANIGAASYAYTEFGMYIAAGIVISAAVSEVFIILTKARTRKSAMWLDQILSLKSFMKTADSNMIAVMKGNNPQYGYMMLPYAYCIDIMPKWAKKCSKFEKEAPLWFKQYRGMTAEQIEETESEEKLLGEVNKESNLLKDAVGIKNESRKGFFDQLLDLGRVRNNDNRKESGEAAFDYDAFAATLKKETDRFADNVLARLLK